MATKRILEKTNNKEEEEDSHDDKKPKLTEETQGKDKEKEETGVEETTADSEEVKAPATESDPINSESTEERVDTTLRSARREWLGQVERRHIRVGDAYQVTSLPTPGESNDAEENGKQNGDKKE